EKMTSPLHELLTSLGGRSDEAAGHDTVAHFGSPLEEYQAARFGATISDRSLLSKIELSGPDRVRFLHNLCTNDIKNLTPGRGCEAFLTNVQGKILAYIRVWSTTDSLWIDTVPGAAPAILEHLRHYLITEKVELADRTEDTAQLLLVGPHSGAMLDA